MSVLVQVSWTDWQGAHYAIGRLISDNVAPHGKTCVRDANGRLQVGFRVGTLYTSGEGS